MTNLATDENMSDTNDNIKAGRRHSEGDMLLGRTVKDSARAIIDAAEKLGFVDDEPPMPVAIDMNTGNTLKALSETPDELRVGNYIALFGGRDISGLGFVGNTRPLFKNADGTHGEFFTKDTHFESDYTAIGRLPIDWEHGLETQEAEKDEVLGYVDWSTKRIDDKGVWVERVLNRRKKYVQWVEELVKAGLVGTSSESVPGQARRKATGEIEAWPLLRDTLTVMPAEPRMMTENVISALKALKMTQGDISAPALDNARAALDNAPAAESITKTIINEGIKTMGDEIQTPAPVVPDVTELTNSVKALTDEMKDVKAKLNAPALPLGGRVEAVPENGGWPYKSIGEQLRDVAALELRKGDTEKAHNRLKAVAQKALGMNEAVPSDGGHMVQTAFGTNLLERTYAIGQVLADVQEQPLGDGFNAYSALLIDESSRADGSRYGGIQFYRLGEGGTILPTRPKLRRLKIEAEKIAAACYVTDELLEDSRALEGHVNRLFPQEARFKLEDELFNGTGAGQSLGILNAPATVSVAKETGQAAATFVFKNALKMLSRLWAPSAARAKWYVHQDLLPEIHSLSLPVGTGGAPVFVPPSGAAGAPYGTLLGRPIVPVEYAQTLGTTGDVYLADFSQMLAVTKGGIKTDSSMHVSFLTGEMTFRFQWRFKAEPTWNTALTPKNGSNTISPFVKLDTRA